MLSEYAAFLMVSTTRLRRSRRDSGSEAPAPTSGLLAGAAPLTCLSAGCSFRRQRAEPIHATSPFEFACRAEPQPNVSQPAAARNAYVSSSSGRLLGQQ